MKSKLIRSCMLLSLLSLALPGCADVQDDEIAASQSKLQKLPDFDEDDSAGGFHAAGDCPHIATYRARLTKSSPIASCGVAGCHTAPNTQGQAQVQLARPIGTRTPEGQCQQCHTGGGASVAPELATLKQSNGNLTCAETTACHGVSGAGQNIH